MSKEKEKKNKRIGKKVIEIKEHKRERKPKSHELLIANFFYE